MKNAIRTPIALCLAVTMVMQSTNLIFAAEIHEDVRQGIEDNVISDAAMNRNLNSTLIYSDILRYLSYNNELVPYRTDSTESYTTYIDKKSFGGNEFENVFCIGGGRELYFNLNDEYKSIAFNTGCRDTYEYGGSLEIYGDGSLITSIPRQSAEEGILDISVDTYGIKMLKIVGIESYASVFNINGEVYRQNEYEYPLGKALENVSDLECETVSFLGKDYDETYKIGNREIKWENCSPYSSLSFLTGCRDEQLYGGAIKIYADDELIYNIPKRETGDGIKMYNVSTGNAETIRIVSDESFASVVMPRFSNDNDAIRYIYPSYITNVTDGVSLKNVFWGEDDDSTFISIPENNFVTFKFSSPVITTDNSYIRVLTTGNVNEEADVYIKYLNSSEFKYLTTLLEDKTEHFIELNASSNPISEIKFIGKDFGGDSPGFDIANIYITGNIQNRNINISNIPLIWSGEYIGHSGENNVKRKYKLEIENIESNGIFTGIGYIYPEEDHEEYATTGAYQVKGRINKNTGEVDFEGIEWVCFPEEYENFTLGDFNTYLSDDLSELNGYNRNNLSHTIRLSAIQNRNISIDSIPLLWVGEYDGHTGDEIVRRKYKLKIAEIKNDGSLEGVGYIYPKEGVEKSTVTAEYYLNGKINLVTGKIDFQGNKWIKYPEGVDNFSFVKFSAYISDDYTTISGYCANNLKRTVDLKIGDEFDPLDDSNEDDILKINFKGKKEIQFDKDKKAYNTDKFKMYVIAEKQRNIINFNSSGVYTGQVKIKLTAPDGFSFSSDGTEKVREISTSVNLTNDVDIFLASPSVGNHKFIAEITDARGKTYSGEYELKVIKTGFNEDIYKANHNVTQGYAVGSLEEFVIDKDTPAEILKKAANENGMDWSSCTWDVLNKSINALDDPSKIMDYTLEEKDVYKAMIFEMLDCKIENTVDDGISNDALMKFKNSEQFIINELKDIYTYDELTNEFFTDRDRRERAMECVNNRFKEDFPDIADTEDINDFFFKPIEYAGNFFDIYEQVYNYYQIRMVDNSVKNMLVDMYNEVPSDNLSLKAALYETKEVIEASEEEFMAEMTACSVQMAGKDAAQYGIKKVWGKAKNKAYEACPTLALAHAIIKGGQFFADGVFNTSKITEAYYKLGAVNNIGFTVGAAYNKQKKSFKANKNETNAKNYNAAVNFLGAYYILNCDTAKGFPDAVEDAAFSKAFGVEGTQELKTSIENTKKSIKGMVNSANTEWIEWLSEDYPELYDYYDTNRDKFKVYDIHCPVDVYVFDKNGVLVASAEGNSIYYDGEAKLTIARDGDEKTVYTYGDEYKVIYKATDNGTMDIIVNEYSDGEKTATVNFNNVTLVKDDEYISEENGKYGEEANYSLEKADGKVLPDYDSNENKVKYKLNVEKGVIAGTALQSGEFCAGEKVNIITYIPENAEFIGWESNAGNAIFDDVKAVSTVITMPASNVEVKANINVTAPSFLFGDADGDNVITASDAASILQKTLVSTFELPIQKKTDDWLKYADVDCDSSITASDAAFVLQKTLVSTFKLPAESGGVEHRRMEIY